MCATRRPTTLALGAPTILSTSVTRQAPALRPPILGTLPAVSMQLKHVATLCPFQVCVSHSNYSTKQWVEGTLDDMVARRVDPHIQCWCARARSQARLAFGVSSWLCVLRGPPRAGRLPRT